MSDEKLNVLFVDDEQKIVDGLRRQLRERRQQWEMRFATGGDAALAMLAAQPADVVVSDMRMPGMSGGQLLRRVRDEHPQATRIILSGQTDQADLLCELGCIHQYLQKPCDGELLCRAIERTRSLSKLLDRPALRLAVNRVTALPPATETYHALITELAKPDSGVSTVGSIVARDPALSAKLMQLVNSAFFGMPRRVASPDAAVSLLGLNTVHGIVVAGRIFDFVAASVAQQVAISSLWQSSVRVGEAAAGFAEKNGAGAASIAQARLAGLLSLIGRVILLTATPDDYAKVSAMVTGSKSTYAQAEQTVYGATQDHVSAYALGLWAFPAEIVEAAAYQTRPSSLPAGGKDELTGYLHLARTTHRGTACGMDDPVEPDREFLDRSGLASLISGQTRTAA